MDTMSTKENAAIDYTLAKAIFISGSPLSLVEHPLWIECMKKLRPSYQLPSRKYISTTLLDLQYTEMRADISQIVDAKNIHLQCDGWSNIRNQSIINFVISKPEPLFVEFLPTEANKHTGEYLCQKMAEIIEKHNPQKFFAVIGDNAANMKKTFALLKEKYNHIVPLGYICHTLQLLCTDILSCNSSNEFLNCCTQIIKTIKNVHVLNALFAKINEEKNIKISLKMPVKTRWGSYLDTLQSLLTCKSTLQTLAVNEQAAKSLSRELKSRILDDNIFWVRVEKLVQILQPIVALIKKFESNDCLIHMVHYALKELQSTLIELLPQSPLTKKEEKTIIQKMEERKEIALSPIHLAAALLDPVSQGCNLSPDENVDAMEFIHKVSADLNIEDLVSNDLASYCAQDGLWAKPFIWLSSSSVSPLVWWKGMCRSSRLSEVAVRILSAPVSSAATERSFSTFSWIHNKRRNRLTNLRAGKITYLAHNWKLQQKTRNKNKTENEVIIESEISTHSTQTPQPGPSGLSNNLSRKSLHLDDSVSQIIKKSSNLNTNKNKVINTDETDEEELETSDTETDDDNDSDNIPYMDTEDDISEPEIT